MREPFLDFEWHVHPTYHWQDWLDVEGHPVVVPEDGLLSLESDDAVQLAWEWNEDNHVKTGPVLSPVDDTPRTYRPMQREHATLFLAFAELNYRDKDALLAFANMYGLLGVERQHQAPPQADDNHHVLGESHLTWAREIALMREALSLTRVRPAAEAAEVDARYEKYGNLEHHRAKDRQKLDWLFNVHLQHVQARMAFERELPARLSFKPLTLLSAMWLQLAFAIADDKQFLTCKFCRRLFEISTKQTGFRRHREFCSDSCKTKDYRRRRRTALHLIDEGESVLKVAELTATKAETIRRWVKANTTRRRSRKEDG